MPLNAGQSLGQHARKSSHKRSQEPEQQFPCEAGAGTPEAGLSPASGKLQDPGRPVEGEPGIPWDLTHKCSQPDGEPATCLLLVYKLVRLAQQRIEGLAGASLRAGVPADGKRCNVDQTVGAARRVCERLQCQKCRSADIAQGHTYDVMPNRYPKNEPPLFKLPPNAT